MAQQVVPAGTPIGSLLQKNYKIPEGQPDGIAADAIDPVTGEYLSIALGFDPLDAWVLGQLAVVRASGSAVQNDGRDFSEVQKALARDGEILRQEILRPLKVAIDAREIEARVEIEIDEDESSMVGYLTYKNLATGAERRRIPVGPSGLITEAS